jgi:uncharacterized repeat protein (TIGR01451 family)
MTRLSSYLASIFAAAYLLAFSCNIALASGTLANTPISNTATLAYDVNGVVQATITSPAATFVVDNKIDITVIEKSGSPVPVTPGQPRAVTTFTVTNNGNAVQDYALTGGNVAGAPTVFGVADNFNALACNTFTETNGTAGYQAGADTATFIDELAPDTSLDVYVVCDIPAVQSSNDQAVTELTAVTRAGNTAGLGVAVTQTVGVDNPAAVDIVFADATASEVISSQGTRPIQIARDATGFARDAYRVAAVVTTVGKSATCKLTPAGTSTAANCNQAKTGTIITYTIQVNVTGGGTAEKLFITDPIPSDILYTPNSITIGAIPRTDVVDADNVQFTTVALPAVISTQQPAVPANTAIINLGDVSVTLATPKTFIITLKATIN